MANYLDNDIKFVAGVGEARARLLEKELGIRTLGDMLCHYPFRDIDRTRIYRIDQIAEGDSALIQFRGRITGVSYAGAGRKRRFTAVVNDGSGVAHQDGQAVFVPLTAPGDIAEVRIVKPLSLIHI